ncbi:MAG TPA: MaoC family dehydratase N-terminal domain-containing protein [Dehalococcoidia bacterium]|nr:MaoC family dehydratase N-terminal domain-containing protein [Dehalococcoidia bacterium]
MSARAVQSWSSRRWQDVSEGEELPPFDFPITVTRLVMAVAGTRDLYAVHHDPAVARRQGARDMFANTMFFQGLINRYLSDWGGPESYLRKLGISMRDQVCPGDMVTVKGRVTKKYERDGQKLVDLDVVIMRGEVLSVQAWATLELV